MQGNYLQRITNPNASLMIARKSDITLAKNYALVIKLSWLSDRLFIENDDCEDFNDNVTENERVITIEQFEEQAVRLA